MGAPFASSSGAQRNHIFAFPAYESLLVFTGLLVLPMSSPVLRPSTWVQYTTALHLRANPTETGESGPLPQFFADRCGWEKQYDIVSRAFHSLPSADQQRISVFGKNYGETGNLDCRNRLYTLPYAISGHNSSWSWGLHGCDPNLVIAIIQDSSKASATKYASVTLLDLNSNPYSMPFEHGNIYLLRDRKSTAAFDWANERFFYE